MSIVTVIIGAKGTGKTFFAGKEIKKHERVYALDPHGAAWSGNTETLELAPYDFQTACRKYWNAQKFKLILVPEFDLMLASETLARLAFERGNLLAVFDEAGDYMSNSKTERYMGRLIRRARHRNVDIILISPRLTDIATEVRTQVDQYAVCGRVTSPRDLAMLEDYTTPEFAAQCARELTGYRTLTFSHSSSSTLVPLTEKAELDKVASDNEAK